jgi:hypothetical protein
VLAVAAVLAWASGTPRLAIAIAVVILLNAAFSFAQELQAGRAGQAAVGRREPRLHLGHQHGQDRHPHREQMRVTAVGTPGNDGESAAVLAEVASSCNTADLRVSSPERPVVPPPRPVTWRWPRPGAPT